MAEMFPNRFGHSHLSMLQRNLDADSTSLLSMCPGRGALEEHQAVSIFLATPLPFFKSCLGSKPVLWAGSILQDRTTELFKSCPGSKPVLWAVSILQDRTTQLFKSWPGSKTVQPNQHVCFYPQQFAMRGRAGCMNVAILQVAHMGRRLFFQTSPENA